MGYQVVDVILMNGQVIRDGIVLNAEELLLPAGHDDVDVAEISEIRLRK
jgi:hypothetical protein